MIEFSSPKHPKGDNSWFKVNDHDNKDHKHSVLSFGSCFDIFITSSMLIFPCVCVVVYHDIRPL